MTNTLISVEDLTTSHLFEIYESVPLLLKEETDRTGSVLKAGLHLGPDCGL